MKKEEIIHILIDNHYPEVQAEGVACELMAIDEQLVPLLENWTKNKEESDYSVDCFSLMGLKKQYSMSYPAALLSIDWLIKDPLTAKQAILRGIK